MNPDIAADRLAVLPFENISKDGEAYFAAGMTEEVSSQLSKLGGLRVVSRTAVAQFKDPRSQLAAMSTELGVGSVVAGTVREDGKRVRVNVELIDTILSRFGWGMLILVVLVVAGNIIWRRVRGRRSSRT